MKVNVLSIDLAKEIFYIYGVDSFGKSVIDKSCRRAELAEVVNKFKPETVFMEACGTSNFWARKFLRMGCKVKLISPQHVKMFVGRQKNDRNDAKAILEAGLRPDMKFVPIKDLWQQDLQSLHRIRQRVISARIQIGNEILGLLGEYGIFIRKGKNQILRNIQIHLEDAENELTTTARRFVEGLVQEFKKYLELEKRYTTELTSLAEASKSAKRFKLLKELVQ